MQELFSMDKVMGFCEKVCYFFMVNLLFLISNIPFFLFLLFVGAGQIRECLPLFLVCLLPVAPALSAVLYAMNRVIHGTERAGFHDYKKGYCSGFLQKIKLGACQLFAVFVFWTNLEFFAVQIRVFPLMVLFVILFVITVLVTPNLYMLASRYEMKNIQIVKTAVTLLIAKPVLTLGSVASFVLILAAFEISAGTTVLFMGSVYGFLIMFINQGIFRELEKSE
ncbi:hypothetical protein D7X88_09240 [bacterium C-53]|nr:hypothetical protein [Lachnospiraceae bacterium]NBI03224.1 hypothetical protein [Lachnospiraceae bacterium]RKJ10109.1 hypothetical protein D7X88_09240 [bacterium C-53]